MEEVKRISARDTLKSTQSILAITFMHGSRRRLSERLYGLRLARPELELGPDGKALILLHEDERSWALAQFSCSLQQREHASDVALHRAVRSILEEELKDAAKLLPGLSASVPADITVNGAGAFEVGGPEGDNGLSGKKLVVDAYGPRVPIGGGAWSGKDFFKADRAGGLLARRLAKVIVHLGLAAEATVTLGWFPGDRAARVLRVDMPRGCALNSCAGGGDAGNGVDLDRIADLIDLSLLRSGRDFANADLLTLARWGHFSNPDLPWERIERL